MDSPGSVASTEKPGAFGYLHGETPSINGVATEEPRPPSLKADVAIAVAIAAVLLAFFAFAGDGGLQLGPLTLVEVIAIATGSLLAAAAVLLIGFDARLHGAVALAALAGLVALTSLSILWSLFPSDSWVEANRTLAYVAIFAGGIAAVRLLRERWAAVLLGVLGALAIVCLYGLATKVAPGLLASDEIYARLREPYGYWNAVGVTAAMGAPLCFWLGTRKQVPDWVPALAWPALGMFFVTIMLSYSRGAVLAVAVGIALWFAFVPRRLQSLLVLLPTLLVSALVTGLGLLAERAFGRSHRALGPRGLGRRLRRDPAGRAGRAVRLRARASRAARACGPSRELAHRRVAIAALVVAGLLALASLAALASTDRGVTGTLSDRWHDLTHEQGTPPPTSPGRLTETGSVRTIYYARALKVWKQDRLKGAGAGAFDKAQLRFRDNAAQGRHAHGYVHQTLADLGLLGLARQPARR